MLEEVITQPSSLKNPFKIKIWSNTSKKEETHLIQPPEDGVLRASKDTVEKLRQEVDVSLSLESGTLLSDIGLEEDLSLLIADAEKMDVSLS